MALTNAQMRDRVYLQTMLGTINRLRSNALRAAGTTYQKNTRLLTQNNALNGINGGAEETSYVRLLQDNNSTVNNINAQYGPQIAELQGYLDILNARRSSGGKRASGSTGNVFDRDAYDLAVRQSYAQRLREEQALAQQQAFKDKVNYYKNMYGGK